MAWNRTIQRALAGLNEPFRVAEAYAKAKQDAATAEPPPLLPEGWDDEGRSGTRPTRRPEAQNVEFTFVGGAGTGGAYLNDFKRAFEGAGIRDVKVPNDGEHDLWDPHVLGDVLAVPSVNDTEFAKSLGGSKEIEAAVRHSAALRERGEQFNLGGYSYGSAASAAMALAIAEAGGHVDNLVLVGAPINQDLYDAVRAHPNIGQVIVKDLSAQGDPIRPGMSDTALVGTVPKLLEQAPRNKGHFYYSGRDAQGDDRRDQLARELVRRGVT